MVAAQSISGLHAHWTAPRVLEAARQGWSVDDLALATVLPDEELITMIFSALSWRSFHGPITLFADTPTVRFLDERGLLGIYDAVRSAEIDRIDVRRFAPDLYFSLPKIVALRASIVPVAVLDLDLFVRVPVPDLGPNDFLFAHHETLFREEYPTIDALPNPNGIEFPGWDDDLPACNMAFAGFGNQRHLDDFTSLALAYLVDNSEDCALTRTARVVFAEQRLSAYTARTHGVTLTPLTPSIWDTATGEWTLGAPEDVFHHTWHRKRSFTPRAALRYRVRLVEELVRQFPDAMELLLGDRTLARYAEAARSGRSALR